MLKFTREIVATAGSVGNISGQMRVMTGEMRELMKAGIKRTLIPAKDFKKPPLKLDKEAKRKIATMNKEIKRLNWEISKLELKKSQIGIDTHEIAQIDAEIERLQFNIFEMQHEIRDFKIEYYRNQTSSIDLDA